MSAAGPTAGQHPVHSTSPLRVLVVDDSAAYRHGIVRALERDPRFAVAAVFDDGDAVAVAACAFDVLLLDYLLQTTNGLDLLEDVRALGVLAPAVLMSATLSPAVEREAARIGFAATLDKGLSRREICDDLARACARPLQLVPDAR